MRSASSGTRGGSAWLRATSRSTEVAVAFEASIASSSCLSHSSSLMWLMTSCLAAMDQQWSHIRESLRAFSQHQIYAIRFTLADAGDEVFCEAVENNESFRLLVRHLGLIALDTACSRLSEQASDVVT